MWNNKSLNSLLKLVTLSIIGVASLLSFKVSASFLDWDANTWPAPVGGTPTLSQVYSVGGGETVTITISGDTSALTTIPDASPSAPQSNNFLSGGLAPDEDGLFLRMNFPNGSPAVNAQTISVTYTFSHAAGVAGVSYTIFDIDADTPQWVDQVTGTATLVGGGVVNPTSMLSGPANTSDGINIITGNLAFGNADNNTADGNATFNFFTAGIRSFTFTYSNQTPDNTAINHNQWATMHDIFFNPPEVADKIFSPSTIAVGEVSTLTLTIDNLDPATAATLTSDFVDTMPAGVSIANPANIGGSCPGTVNAPVGGNTVTYTTGSQIPAGASCTIIVDVTSSTPGTHTNTIPVSALATNLGDNSTETSSDLIVNFAAPTLTKTFATDPIALGASSTMTLTLTNSNTVALTGTSVADTYPTQISNATPANAATTCGGTLSAIDGGASVGLTGGTIPASGSCTVTVDVTSTTAGGPYTNTTGVVSTNEAPDSTTASDDLTVTATTPPTIAKSFNPSSINPGGTSQLTITLGNTNTSAITLTANMDDNLPVSVTATSVNAATTCTAASVDISVNTRIRYLSAATIPSGGCDIVVDVTSNTLGVTTNTIPAGSLQTTAGNNANPANDNLTVTAGGGAPTCPSGTNLVTLGTSRNADAVAAGAGVPNATEALGVILVNGSALGNGNSARLRNADPTLVLDLTDTVPENGTIILSIARNNNPANYDIDSSINVGGPFGGAINFAAGPNDISQQISYTVPSGGARYIRFDRNGGSLWVDGVQYSQICEPILMVDLSITKDDGSVTYTPGGSASYTIVVTNNGPDDVAGAAIADNLPNGVTLSGPWSCVATAGSSCSAANGGVAGGNAVNLTADILNGGSLTINVPVNFSSNMGDY